MFGGKLIVLPNRGTDMMCQNTFDGKMIISHNYLLQFTGELTLFQPTEVWNGGIGHVSKEMI